MSSGVCLGLPMTMRRWIAVFESQDVPAVMVEGPFLRVSVIVSARSSGFLEAHNQKRMLRLSVRASSLPGLFEACREASMTGTPIEGVSAGADALVGRRVLRLNAAFRTLAGVDDDMRLATCEASDVIDAALRRWNARQSDPFADLWPTNLVDAEALDLARRALRRFLSDGVRAMSQNGVIDHDLSHCGMVIHSSWGDGPLSLELVGFQGPDALKPLIEDAALAALRSSVAVSLIDCPDYAPSGEGAFMSRLSCCAPLRRALAYVSLYDAPGEAIVAHFASPRFLGMC